jgi:hypothetical protein
LNPDGVVHLISSAPLSIARPTSFSIHFITLIGPGTTSFIALRTALTTSVSTSFSTSTPFSFNASRMYDLFEKGLALYGTVITVRFVVFLSMCGRIDSGTLGFATSAMTLYASCGLSLGSTLTRRAVDASLASPASI